jgi:hypothetical protein
MIGLIIVISLIIIEIFLLTVLKKVWLKGGLFSSIMLGMIASVFLILAEINGRPENYVLDSFFILNMILPVLFGIEIHLFAKNLTQRRREKRAKRDILKWERGALK